MQPTSDPVQFMEQTQQWVWQVIAGMCLVAVCGITLAVVFAVWVVQTIAKSLRRR
jgi:hypothetical protein